MGTPKSKKDFLGQKMHALWGGGPGDVISDISGRVMKKNMSYPVGVVFQIGLDKPLINQPNIYICIYINWLYYSESPCT